MIGGPRVFATRRGPRGEFVILDAIAAMFGRWKLPHSSIVVEIAPAGDGLDIRAIDSDDGEELRIDDIQVDDREIAFVLVTPSTNWTVHKAIAYEENDSISCVTTRVDSWERIS